MESGLFQLKLEQDVRPGEGCIMAISKRYEVSFLFFYLWILGLVYPYLSFPQDVRPDEGYIILNV